MQILQELWVSRQSRQKITLLRIGAGYWGEELEERPWGVTHLYAPNWLFVMLDFFYVSIKYRETLLISVPNEAK